MPRRLLAGSALLIALFLASCFPVSYSIPTPFLATITLDPGAPPSPTPFPPGQDLPTASLAPVVPSPTPSPTPWIPPQLSPPPVGPQTYYYLDASLDYAGHTLSVDEIILYQNSTGTDLSSFVLAVEPSLWKNCFSLAGLMVNGQLVNNLEAVSGRMEVPLPAVLIPGGSLNIILHYELALPPADPFHVFGYSQVQTNLVDWFPFIVPYSNGWLLHPPANVGEHLVYPVAKIDVKLHVKDPGLSLVVAASAPALQEAGTWSFHLDQARTFALSLSPDFQTAVAVQNGIPVTSYYFEGERSQGLAVLDAVTKAVSTYASLFGSYPYPSLSIVESPFFDGMEYDGLFLLSRDFYRSSDGAPLSNLVDIAVHETAHQWWFGSVGSDQAQEPWLDEALATFSESLFYERSDPPVAGWEGFRIDSFSPSGWVDTDIYQGHDFRTYANAVYLRGALFLQALRERLGDDVFFAFLQDYASQMSGKIASSSDFFRILRSHTNADLSDLIAEFFRDPH